MSSRILAPGEQHKVVQPPWQREVAPEGAPGDKPAPPKSTPPERDASAELARMQQQCEQRIAEARTAGLREGEAAGRSRSAAEQQAVIERLARSIEEIAGLRQKLRREAESDMIRLSLAIARRILHREVSVDPEAMHGLVLGALEKLQGQEIARLRVHPSHVAPVTACLRQAAPGSVIEVLPDPSRQPGAAFFETAHGDLDASVDSQLQEIERGLVDRLKRQP